MTGIHAHFMIQMLMYCWNLRKLCKLLDDRRAASHVCQRFTGLCVPQNLSEDLSDHEDDEAESEQEWESEQDEEDEGDDEAESEQEWGSK